MSYRYMSRLLKLVFVVSSIGFLLAHLHYRSTTTSSTTEEDGGAERLAVQHGADGDDRRMRAIVHHRPYHQRERHSVDERSENVDLAAQTLRDIARPLLLNRSMTAALLRAAVEGERRSSTYDRSTQALLKTKAGQKAIDPQEIRWSIEYNNAHTEVRNEEKFGPINASLVVIVVQVHNRPNYLRMLVDSLRQARHIQDTLVIFSHDYFSQEINDIVRRIDFCRVMQIFYPYSIQVFPRQFPGSDPRDCPSTADKDSAKRSGCLNWEHPDKYGHYRVAKLTQIKHHWWWKSNYVFEKIPGLRTFGGWVLYLEEDHYVSPDFIHVLNYVDVNREKLCPECQVISLGVYLKSYATYAANLDRLAVYPWFSSRHNMGMALNRRMWDAIRNCSQLFCTYDDYNWDWSLMKVNMVCLKDRMKVIYAKAPRVFHIGDCGVHHKCKASTSAGKFAELLAASAARLFPPALTVSERSKRMLKPPKENGGWGDVRDHRLCLNNTYASAVAAFAGAPTPG